MASYTTNDALNILYKCEIRTHDTLKMHLAIGGFKIPDSTLWAKLTDLEKNGIIEDLRQTNSGDAFSAKSN